jgi:beta-glucanase (GH16 family)
VGAGCFTVGLLLAAGLVTGAPAPLELAQATSDGSPTDECGAQPVKPTSSDLDRGDHWRCSFVEDFDEPGLDRDRWFVQTTTQGDFGVGGECFVGDPDNVAVADGSLRLTVRQEDTSVPCPRASNPGFATPFTAGSIISTPSLDQTYGRYEIRARMPNALVPGIHFAFWLWPRDLNAYPVTFGDGDHDRWTNGELDVLEWYSRYPYHQVPYIHYAHTYVQTSTGKWVPNDPNITKACLVGRMSDWHTYALEWTPTSIRMLFDGTVCLENTHWTPRNTEMPGPFDQPFMVSLSQALGAIGTDNQWNASTPLPATTEVDYLKVWH